MGAFFCQRLHSVWKDAGGEGLLWLPTEMKPQHTQIAWECCSSSTSLRSRGLRSGKCFSLYVTSWSKQCCLNRPTLLYEAADLVRAFPSCILNWLVFRPGMPKCASFTTICGGYRCPIHNVRAGTTLATLSCIIALMFLARIPNFHVVVSIQDVIIIAMCRSESTKNLSHSFWASCIYWSYVAVTVQPIRSSNLATLWHWRMK